MNQVIPKFAVVGRVNKGKSSIVSTLAEDDSVVIEYRAETTTICREFPVRIDNKEQMILIDTPGFSEAPEALSWLKTHEVSAAERGKVVADFVRHFDKSDNFIYECRLLKPIIEGAGILYVVDGAKPFRKNYEAEMEILRWTGRPRMALINYIGEGNYSDQWMSVLDQYFSIVRRFNANLVTFSDRIRLLESFRELHEPWRIRLDQAIQSIKNEWSYRQRKSANIIGDLIVDQLIYTRELSIMQNERLEDRKHRLEQEFHDELRQREQEARRAIEKLYKHKRLETNEEEFTKPIFDEDLFAESTWRLLGLTAKQLIGLGAITGATLGGMIDTATGGASLLLGTLIGAAIGAGSALYYSAQKLETIENFVKYMQGAKVIQIGPYQNKNFPWILLDRALLHYVVIRNLTHSCREWLTLRKGEEKVGIVYKLENKERRTLSKLFEDIRSRAGSDVSKLQKSLDKVLIEIIVKL